MALRTRLYDRLGAGRARQMLAAAYPGGSARSDIKRRVLMKSEKTNDSRGALTSTIIAEIVEELVLKSEELSKQEGDKRMKEALS